MYDVLDTIIHLLSNSRLSLWTLRSLTVYTITYKGGTERALPPSFRSAVKWHQQDDREGLDMTDREVG